MYFPNERVNTLTRELGQLVVVQNVALEKLLWKEGFYLTPAQQTPRRSLIPVSTVPQIPGTEKIPTIGLQQRLQCRNPLTASRCGSV